MIGGKGPAFDMPKNKPHYGADRQGGEGCYRTVVDRIKVEPLAMTHEEARFNHSRGKDQCLDARTRQRTDSHFTHCRDCHRWWEGFDRPLETLEKAAPKRTVLEELLGKVMRAMRTTVGPLMFTSALYLSGCASVGPKANADVRPASGLTRGELQQQDPQAGQDRGDISLPSYYQRLYEEISATPRPEFSEWHALKGFDHYERWQKSGDVEELRAAVKAFTDAINIEPKADYYRCRGTVYQRLGDLQKAIEDYSSSIAIDPSNAKTYRFRAAVYHKIGDHLKAAEDWKRSKELEGNSDGKRR